MVFHHSAITYGGSGGWYYHELRGGAAPLLDLFCAINQSYFMGLFFLIAGYLTPPAVARHGASAYLRERAARLGVPLAFYFFVLSPITIALAATARGRSFFSTLSYDFTHGVFENGPLWFAEALLIFTLVYLAGRALAPRAFALSSAPKFPSNRMLFLAALLTGAVAFALRFVWPTGATLFGLQLGYFPSYVALFAAGVAGAALPSLDVESAEQRRLWTRIAWATFPVLPIVVILGRHFPSLAGATSGGGNVQAFVYALWEPFLAIGIILFLLHRFARRFASLDATWSLLARRAYTIYVIHPPVLVAVALSWSWVVAPPLMKFLATGSAACLVCHGLAGLLLRSAWLRRVL